MPAPRVSIITPSYNQGGFIKATIASVLGQDYPSLEYWVVDGGSTDNTLAVLQSIQDPRLHWVSEPDNGQSSAINKGLRGAEGDILAYLNSDDIYLPGAVRFAVDYFDAHPDADLIYGDCMTIDGHGQPTLPALPGQPYNAYHLFTTRLDIPQPTVFWRRRVTERIGLFDESLHYTMDVDYWLRTAAAGFKLVYVPGERAAFRLHGESKTGTVKLGFWRDWQTLLEKIYRQNDLPPHILGYKRAAFAYVNWYGAALYWSLNQRAQARPLLRRMVMQGPWRPRVVGAAMLVDSYLNTAFADGLRRIYNRVVGVRSN